MSGIGTPMYADLLAAALATTAGEGSETPDLVDSALRARRHVRDFSRSGSDGVAASVAGQLAYDVSLVVLCRATGVDCPVGAFGQPGRARADLERTLIDRGIFPTELGAE